MSEWQALCGGPGITLHPDHVLVTFENGRKHRVRVREADEYYAVHAVVLKSGPASELTDLPLRLWQHNRAAQLVSFRIDRYGRVYAEGWVPRAGITAEEFQLVVRRVAAESDRLEYMLTGKDVE